MSKAASASLYNTLSYNFISLMEVLHAIRGFSDPANDLTPLQVFELWTDAKSQYAFNLLRKHTPYPTFTGSQLKQ